MKITHTALAAAALVLATSEVSVAQSSFDCRQPRSEAAATICATPQLAERDRQVDAAYRRALQTAAEPNRVRDNHAAWSRSLSVCGTDLQCIGQSLDEELAALEYAATTGARETEGAEAEYREPKPVHGPTPPIEQKPAEPSPAAALEDASGLMHREPVADDVTAPIPDELRNPERFDSEAGPPVESTSGSDTGTSRPSSISQMIGGGVILALIVAVLAALLATKALADRSMSRYGWPMILNWWNVLHVAAVFAFYVGWMFAGPLAGAIVAGGLWLIVTFVNIRKTNLGLGLLISVVQPLVVWILYAVIAITRHKPTKYDYRT